MINSVITLRLASLPVIWMGSVHLAFALISLLILHDNHFYRFFESGFSILCIGCLMFFSFRKTDMSKASFRDALIYATAAWIISGFLGSVPIILIAKTSITDGVFESVSALTTTGATILSNLDQLPKSFLLYRQFLQWMGGLGIVIFVVAVLPMLNIGGMKLLKAETPGPMKDEKLSPRVANTAHYLWGVYIVLTLLCTLAYYLGGMTFFDALAHSLTTVSTGGFSTHDASMWYYQSHTLLWLCNIFMLLGAINFGLHFRFVYQKTPGVYRRDEETRVFLYVVVGLSLILTFYLYGTNHYPHFSESLSFSFFHLISFITSTGFGAGNYTEWPAAAAFILIFAGYLGGCAGSTAGGNKIIRNILSVKIIIKTFRQMLHPWGVFPIKYQGESVKEDVRSAVMSFMFFAAGSSMVLTLMLVATGLDFWSSFTAVAACVNVLGPGFGAIGSNFEPVSNVGTWILSGAMILGRLEYFTVFALFSPVFWRK